VVDEAGPVTTRLFQLSGVLDAFDVADEPS
jgi:hypothetical protein